MYTMANGFRMAWLLIIKQPHGTFIGLDFKLQQQMVRERKRSINARAWAGPEENRLFES